MAAAGLAAIAYLVIKNWDSVKTFFSGLFDWILDKWEKVKASFAGAASTVGNAMGGGGEMTIPMMANGGIVNRPTLAMIGEAGPEAVVPLSGRSTGAGKIGSGSSGPITISQVFHISGGNRGEVEAGVSSANDSLMQRLQALQGEEERVSYA